MRINPADDSLHPQRGKVPSGNGYSTCTPTTSHTAVASPGDVYNHSRGKGVNEPTRRCCLPSGSWYGVVMVRTCCLRYKRRVAPARPHNLLASPTMPPTNKRARVAHLSAPGDCDAFHHDWSVRVVVCRGHLRYFDAHVEAFGDLAKDRVLRRP